MSKRKITKMAPIAKFGLAATAAAACLLTLPLQAQVAQRPLLSSASPVAPNIVFILDDSSSMPGDAVYQYGGSEGVYGMSGPGSSGSSSLTNNQYASQSPDVNLIYYDPRVTYKLRVNADGTTQTPGTFSNSSTFKVYFYGKAGTFRLATVTLTDGGIYASQPANNSFRFPTAPSGGTTATVSVGTAASKRVSGISMTKAGLYSSCPAAASVSIAGPGGSPNVPATVTGVSCSSASNGVQAIPLVAGNTFPNGCAAGTYNATFSGGSGGSGGVIQATITGTGASKVVSSFNIIDPGSGYSNSSRRVRVSCGGQNRDYNFTRAPNGSQRITGVTVSANIGYSATPPAVSFPAGTLTATGTASIADAWRVSSVTIGNPGAKYSAPPEITTSPTALAPATFDYTYTNDPGTNISNVRWDGTGTAQNQSDFFTSIAPGFSYAGYLPDSGSPLAAGASLIPYPNEAKSTITQYPKFINRTDCAAATHCTWDEEKQNYANWKTYHGDRLEIAKTGIGLAFQPLAVASGQPQFRLGWATINRLNNNNGLDKGVRDFNNTVRTDFFTWLYQNPRTLTASTPNKNALDKIGKYFQRGDADGPWSNTPNGNSTHTTVGTQLTTHATCRRSYALLMTDGYYGDNISVGDWDSTERTVTTTPSTFVYTPTGPYSDKKTGSGISNTFADVAAKYYLTDLQPDLPNNVRAVTGDEAYWQHLNFYAIGLGVNGTLDASSPAVLASLTGAGRTKDWPTPSTTSRTSIDDMWHATLNARGRMLSAKTSDELSDAISKMISEISGKEGTQAGVAVSTASLTKGSKKYTPSYTPGSWEGNLIAYKLNSANANQLATPAWQVETEITGTNPKQYSSTIPDDAVRKVFAGNGGTSAPRAVNFTHTDLGGTLRGQMGTAAEITVDLVNYLRGDNANENTLYRKRATRLGDIVNSTPVYVKDTLDMQYNLLPSGTPGAGSYADFLTLKKARTEGVIFVGANDGMLHAFRDGTYDEDGGTVTAGGAEVFAYVPYAVLPGLKDLASKTYAHRYYVDGPNVEADAYIGGNWKNIVIGSTGAGAGTPASNATSPRTSVFAIDVTKLNTSAGITSLGAGDVMWEVGSWMADFVELGHVLQDVQTGVTTGGQWVAVFGNGYGSKSCKAQLFVVNLADGSLLRKIDTGVGSGNCSTANASANGLGGVRLVRNKEQQIVGAYAGDLQGNLWRFDLSNSSNGAWTSSKLFAGTATQPITAPPTVVPLPMIGATKPDPGYMVVFGTGKFYEEADLNTTNTQRLYGIHDAKLFGETAGTTVTGVTELQEQLISAGGTVNGNTFYKVSNVTVPYDGAGAKRGWYINLTNSNKQRIIYPMELLAQRFIAADTMAPEGVPTDPCSTEFGGVGFLYVVDALNGGGPTEAILDTNGDGNVNADDLIVSGVEGRADGRNVSLLVSQNDVATTYANVSASAGSTIIKIPCALTNSCKVTGGGTYQRQWRQLFLR